MTERMVRQFMEMVRIDSESGNEARFMAYLLGEAAALGGAAALDPYGNLIASFPAMGCEGAAPGAALLPRRHGQARGGNRTVLEGGVDPLRRRHDSRRRRQGGDRRGARGAARRARAPVGRVRGQPAGGGRPARRQGPGLLAHYGQAGLPHGQRHPRHHRDRRADVLRGRRQGRRALGARRDGTREGDQRDPGGGQGDRRRSASAGSTTRPPPTSAWWAVGSSATAFRPSARSSRSAAPATTARRWPSSRR